MGTPLISIVIPTLQEEKLVANTLNAFPKELRAQYSTELIISDGGSTDATLQIAEQLADKVVTHSGSAKQTIAEGRNVGAKYAGGSVIVFINADTVPANPKQFLAIIFEFANSKGQYHRASALACPVHFAPQERKIADNFFHGFYNLYVRSLIGLRIGVGRGECQVVRTEVFAMVGGYRQNLAAGEDFDLFARIGVKARVRFAPELLVFESPRRFRKFGYLRVLYWWTINAVSVFVRGRSSSDEWEAVR